SGDSEGEALGADPLALGVEERLPSDLPLDPGAEDLDRHRRSRLRVLGGQVGVGDGALDRVAVATAGYPAADLPVDPHRLVPERDRSGVLEQQAAEARSRAALLGLDQGLAADEAAVLVQLHAEADPTLIGRLVRGDVRAPDAVALLEPHGV